ncbi:UNVERIFIED_CONTAM: hypothetical protein HDU68_002368 [Siphonaria sp. JEL0065]|nr:hypothetical protein HDU68_002368 [Siphonaria sp. JEL0065]
MPHNAPREQHKESKNDHSSHGKFSQHADVKKGGAGHFNVGSFEDEIAEGAAHVRDAAPAAVGANKVSIVSQEEFEKAKSS